MSWMLDPDNFSQAMGALLLTWFFIGLVSSFKVVYIDDVTYIAREFITFVDTEFEGLTDDDLVYYIKQNKALFFLLLTLLGPCVVVLDTKATFKTKTEKDD